jgi:hypothetical protein
MTTIDPQAIVKAGDPILYCMNRQGKPQVMQMNVAHGGRIAIVRTAVSGNTGLPIRIRFRMATPTHILGWGASIGGSPISICGYTAIFAKNNPIEVEGNELKVVRDFDLSYTFKPGFKYFKGFLNMISVT